MNMLVAAAVAVIATAITALAIPVVLDDWIWLVLYMVAVPTAIAAVAARGRQLDFYATTATVLVLISGLVFSLVEAASGYMELSAPLLFLATFPVTVVVGLTGAIVVGLARWKREPAA